MIRPRSTGREMPDSSHTEPGRQTELPARPKLAPAMSMYQGHLYATIPLQDPSRYVRLLHLCSAKWRRRDDPLVSHVRVVSVDNAPPFAALSYVWGSGTGPQRRLLYYPQDFGL